MELNQSFPINSISVHGDSSPVLCLLFLLLNALDAILNEYNNTMEGAYIPFALSKVKLSNLDLIILSTCIKSK